MLSFAREVFHTATAGVFDDEDDRRRKHWPERPRYGGPCHHIADIECDRCRGARREHEPQTFPEGRYTITCEFCGERVAMADLYTHHRRCRRGR